MNIDLKEYATNVTDLLTAALAGAAVSLFTAWLGDRSLFSWVQIVIFLVVFVLAILIQAWIKTQRKHKTDQAYFLIAMSEQDEFPKLVASTANGYFERKGIRQADGSPLEKVAPFTASGWRDLLQRALNLLPSQLAGNRPLHLVCATPWLWALALGTRLGENVDLLLYHHQQGQLYPVWNAADSIKAVVNAPDFAIKSAEWQAPPEDAAAKSAILIVSLGRDVVESTRQALIKTHPDLPVYTLTKSGQLDPADQDAMRQLAAELAWAIETAGNQGSRPVYLAGHNLAVLGLMAGTAVTRLRQLHLLQFFPNDEPLRELMRLPLDTV